MSRIGKKPITVPSGVTVKVSGRDVSVSGPKGNSVWAHPFNAAVSFDQSSSTITVTRSDDTKSSRANHGLTRALIANMVKGVSEGFQKRLLIFGTGYGCKLQGNVLHLSLGFTGRRRGIGSQFELPVPEGLAIKVERESARGESEPAAMVISGFDKQRVGQFAAEIRSLRKTEPYKGKGVRYDDEQVRRKVGKALAGAG